MSQTIHTIAIGLLSGIAGAAFVITTTFPNVPLFQGQRIASPPTSPGTASLITNDSHEATVIGAVQKAAPAVVSVVITKDVPIVEQYFEEQPNPLSPFFGDDVFSPFSFQVPRLRQRGTEKREVGGGSGFIISADGTVITNRHVVADGDAEYTVFLSDGQKHTARVVARDTVNDIAVLKIEATNLPYLEFANSDELQVGQSVIAIGNALSEFRNTVSTGVISGLSRSIVAGDGAGQSEQLDEVIQTDAAINPGNSGGPLLDLAGRVVGVNVAVALGSENIGFALPANLVRSITDTVQREGRIVRPYLGVRYVAVTPLVAERNNLSVTYGVMVVRGEEADELAVIPGSPAAKAGLKEGDIILEIDGQKLDEETSLANIIRRHTVGETVNLKIIQDGSEKTVPLKLEEAPSTSRT